MRGATWCGLCGCVLTLAVPMAAAAEKADAEAGFLRVERDKQRTPIALQTAIVRMAPRDCGQTHPTVDLVAAVHIGEAAYYRQINKEFQQYDAVLYELVAPEGTRIPEGGRQGGGSPVSALQVGLKNLLGLEFQLERVSYTRKNMVHADMTPSELADSMNRRGDGLLAMFVRMIGHALAEEQKEKPRAGDFDLIMALLDKNRALKLKRFMADQFEEVDSMVAAMGGPDGSSLVEERNKAALKVLKRELAGGKKKVAIFYGAAHMKDIRQRLENEFDLAVVETRWLTAWEMKGK